MVLNQVSNTVKGQPVPPRRDAVRPASQDGYTSATAEWKPPSWRQVASCAQPGPAMTAAGVLPGGETVGWSDFALNRHKPGTGYSFFQGSQQELIDLVADHWADRQPGTGRIDLNEVVAVPVPADKFRTTTVEVEPDTQLAAKLFRRRDNEEPYVRVTAAGKPAPAKYAQVILYSKDTLAQNNERSRDSDWEVISVVASPVANEPMDPVTMMRNMRAKAGGTQVNYTADQLLDSIDFWSRHAKVT